MSKMHRSAAMEDFYHARRQAALKVILARFTGENVDLLPYDEVIKTLKVQSGVDRGQMDVPIKAIVGSVNRYEDFTRSFLPRKSVDANRWARVEAAVTDDVGLPPIELFKIGETYFVKDGNHRVSVARQFGATHIHAYVTEIHTRVPLTPDTRIEDLLLKAEYVKFLQYTHLDEIRPNADLTVSVPGQYQVLLEHINVHRYFMGIDYKKQISYEEAVAHWYDTVYLPVIQVIQEQAVLCDFPGRTEADLYIWLAEHRATLENEFKQQIRPEDAVRDLTNHFSSKIKKVFTRITDKFMDAILPDQIESGPPPGQWRIEKRSGKPSEFLFQDILIPVDGQATGWCALDQSIIVAQREQARLHGLHVVKSKSKEDSDAVRSLTLEFEQRCHAAGVQGSLVITTGGIARKICNQGRWSDLVVLNLKYPPSSRPLTALGSGFRTVLQRCPRPVLVVPNITSPLRSAMLAYDGSPKAEEALYVASYLFCCWDISLLVLSVLDHDRVTSQTITKAKDYLEGHDVKATYREESGSAVETILKVADEQGVDFLLMGGYSRAPLLDVALGSVLDKVLRDTHKPLLICR